MNDTRCPHCFADKGQVNPCPHCGYDESEPRGPLVLPLRATLPGPLVVGRVLGQPGGFGITYLGWDPQLNARVAIKEYLPREWAGRESGGTTVVPHSRKAEEAFRYGLEQFLAEGRILAQLDHPNIVRVRQYFEANRTAYLVMDYYEGCSLEDYLEQQGGRVAEETARRLILPVLDGLRAVHGRGILHRDLKPQNIYLARVAAGGVRPVLLDFGAARQALGERSRSLTVVLTPGYAPYEQYHRKGRQGPWTDLYAVGAVLYRMVTGETPPEATERRELDELQPATAYGVSAELSAVLTAALAVAPEGRPQSVEAFQERLGFRAPPPVVEPPPAPAPAPLPTPARWRRWGWLGAGVLAVAVVVGLIWGGWHGLPGGRPPEPLVAGSGPPPAAPARPVEPEPKLPEPPPVTTGTLVIAGSQPSGVVMYVDGARLGSAPQELGELPAGKPVTVTAKQAGYEDYQEKVWIRAGQRTELNVVLTPASPPPPPPLADFAVFRDRLRDGSEGPALVKLPGGTFWMGSPASEAERSSDERRHSVTVAAFALGQYEVTFEEYDRFCAATGREKPGDSGWGRGRRPVINVSWHDATAYAQWLAAQTGKAYRLPSEAEWEYAARAGTETAFWTGRCVTTDQANYDGNYGYGNPDCGAKTGVYRSKKLEVGSFPANRWGLYDTMGNVWEWTCSVYDGEYGGAETRCADSNTGGPLAVRGGGWDSGPNGVRSADRDGGVPPNRDIGQGFRLARSL